MKTEQELTLLVFEIYDLIEHGKMKEAKNKLNDFQHESRRGGLEQARNIILTAANEWCGAHMNTNTVCGQLRHLIKLESGKSYDPIP